MEERINSEKVERFLLVGKKSEKEKKNRKVNHFPLLLTKKNTTN